MISHQAVASAVIAALMCGCPSAVDIGGTCSGPTCPAGEPTACSTDAQCQASFVCRAGACVRPITGTGADGGSCAVVESNASFGSQPIDIIFSIDTSGSMAEEIAAVKRNINTNFAQIIQASQVDYRVIMVARYGTDQFAVCVPPPLGAATCGPHGSLPGQSPHLFHYDLAVESTDSYRKLLATYDHTFAGNARNANYNVTTHEWAWPDRMTDGGIELVYQQPDGGVRSWAGTGITPFYSDIKYDPGSITSGGGWSQWLRPQAHKVFVEITDDNEAMPAAEFDSKLLQLPGNQFGTAAMRRYTFHSLVGVPLKSPPTATYAPTEPLATGKCSTAVNSGANYQTLSMLTGGVRFPVCTPDAFDAVFNVLATGVVTQSRLSCELQVPNPPSGEQFTNQVVVEYTPGSSGSAQHLSQVATKDRCVADAFYVAGNVVMLCPSTCDRVKADSTGALKVFFTCDEAVFIN